MDRGLLGWGLLGLGGFWVGGLFIWGAFIWGAFGWGAYGWGASGGELMSTNLACVFEFNHGAAIIKNDILFVLVLFMSNQITEQS